MKLLLLVSLLSASRDTTFPRIDSLGEVVVTGSPRSATIRQNPIAIVSLSARTLDLTASGNAIDALVQNIPGLNAVRTGPNISKPYIRGLGYNRVLTLYDGIRQEGQQWGDEHGIEVDAYNMTKAEVIKGPASLMYGSDAVAGVVSLFPWMPSEKDEHLHIRLLQEYQANNGLWGSGLHLGARHKTWLWAVRGSRRIAKNYRNSIDGRVYNTGYKESNLSATGGYLSKAGSTTLNLTWYDNLQGIPDGSRDSLTRKFTYQTEETGLDDIRNRPIVPAAELNSYELSPLHQHITHYRLYTHSQYRLRAGEIDAQLGWQQNHRREYNHPAQPSQAGLDVRLNTLNYGIRYLAPDFSNISLSAGINGMLQNNKSLDATDFPIPDYTLFDAGSYLHAKWRKAGWVITTGLRYDIRRLSTLDKYGFTPLEKTFQGASLSLGATYQLSPALYAKANIARGYRSPNITELASNGLDPGAHIIYLGNPGFGPEFSLEEDLGLGGHFNQWEFSAAIFHNAISHYIYLSQLSDASGDPVVDAQGNRTFQYKQAAARLYGAEANWRIHPQALAGFYIDNTLAVTYGINTNPGYKHKGTGGEYLPLIPPARWIINIGEEIKPRSGPFALIHCQAGYEYNAAQHRYLALDGTETPTPGYALINLTADAAIRLPGDRRLQFIAQVNNLTDRAYQDHLSRLKYFEYYVTPPGRPSGIYNMGRNICIKIIADL